MVKMLIGVMWIASLFFVNQVTASVWLAASACLFGIMLRIDQAEKQHGEWRAAWQPSSENTLVPVPVEKASNIAQNVILGAVLLIGLVVVLGVVRTR